jgi:hypothetical protein
LIIPVLYLAVTALSGCSGGDGSTAATTVAPPQSKTTLTGMASKGPIQAGSVQAFAVSLGAVDTSAPIGQGVTDAGGNYTIDIGSYQGPVMVEVTGGTFTDEVSGATVTLKTPLRAIFSNVSTGTKTVAVTPMTELAFRKAKGSGSLTADTISKANSSVATTFGLKDIVSTLPVAGAASGDQKKYAAACGTFSQLVNSSRRSGESLDDALSRVVAQMGDEQEQGGSLSTDSIAMINTAVSDFNNSGKNGTGSTIDPIPTPTSGLLKLGTAGTVSVIAGIDLTLNLPAGIIVDADPITGVVADGVVTISGVAAVGTRNVTVAKYTPAAIGVPAKLHVIMANGLGFPLGEFVTILFDLTTGASFPVANAFSVTSFFAKGLDGAGLSGITATPLSVAGG